MVVGRCLLAVGSWRARRGGRARFIWESNARSRARAPAPQELIRRAAPARTAEGGCPHAGRLGSPREAVPTRAGLDRRGRLSPHELEHKALRLRRPIPQSEIGLLRSG